MDFNKKKKKSNKNVCSYLTHYRENETFSIILEIVIFIIGHLDRYGNRSYTVACKSSNEVVVSIHILTSVP